MFGGVAFGEIPFAGSNYAVLPNGDILRFTKNIQMSKTQILQAGVKLVFVCNMQQSKTFTLSQVD